MTGSGSETETDDELLERVQASRTRANKSPDAHVADPAKSASVAAREATQAPPQEVRSTNVNHVDHAPAVAPSADQVVCDTQHSSRRTKASSLAFILNDRDSGDDEPPRREPPSAQPEANRYQASATETPAAAPRDAIPTPAAVLTQSTATVPKHEHDVPIDTAPPAEANASIQPQPTTPADPTAPPSDEQFVSPFASLANVYRPPPPPVYGAPPVSYVPGQVVSRPHVPAVRPTAPSPAPQVPCFNCSGVLPPTGSIVPRSGYSACVCCQRYYSQVSVRSNRRYCTTCASSATSQPTPRSAPRIAPTTASAADAPVIRPGASLTAATHICALCKESVRIVPLESSSDGLQCNCCLLQLSRSAFSRNQQRPDHPCRRCQYCIKARAMPKKFRGIHKKATHPPAERRPSQAGGQGTSTRSASPSSTSTALPAASESFGGSETVASRWTEEQIHQMEIEVRNFKLAKRSIHRRRTANDLRGSTRVEYEKQLTEEERKLDQKMAKVRRSNPALYDELSNEIKVIRARLTPGERDDAGKNTKQSKKSPQAKPNAKAKAKAKAAAKSCEPKPKKRKSTDSDESEASKPAKRTRKTPAKASATSTTKTTSPAAVSSSSDSSDASPRRTIVTRARTRQEKKPVVVIDLVDSDSD